MNSAKRKLIELVKENTGSHMLDSGGAYGRNFERNQKINFNKQKMLDFEINTYNENSEIDLTINIVPYLSEILELNEVTKMLNSFLTKLKNEPNNDYYYNDYYEMLKNKFEITSDIECINTYNSDSFLSQVLQYKPFNYNNETYVMLQVHGGCDVRGGYTEPYIFKLNTYYGFINPIPTIYGNIDDRDVSTSYNGYSLTYDDSNEDIELNKDSNVNLYVCIDSEM